MAAGLARVAEVQSQLAAYEVALVIRLAELRPDRLDLRPGSRGAAGDGWVSGRAFPRDCAALLDREQRSQRRATHVALVMLALVVLGCVVIAPASDISGAGWATLAGVLVVVVAVGWWSGRRQARRIARRIARLVDQPGGAQERLGRPS